jgi:hypothetical protein
VKNSQKLEERENGGGGAVAQVDRAVSTGQMAVAKRSISRDPPMEPKAHHQPGRQGGKRQKMGWGQVAVLVTGRL